MSAKISDFPADSGDLATGIAAGVSYSPSGVAERLRVAVERSGGPAAVIAKSGVPSRSLSYYLAGQEMKQTRLVALADACGVTVEWLATGRGPMRPGETPPAPPPPAATPSPLAEEQERLRLHAFGTLDVDLLAECVEAVWNHLNRPGFKPNWRPFVQAVLLLYDQGVAVRAAERRRKPETTPP